MLGNVPHVAFVSTTDYEKARRFYESVLGLPFKGDQGFALIFDLAGTMLRVTKVEKLTPQPFTVLGWSVKDIRAMVKGLEARGVVVEKFGFLEQDELGIWSAPGGAKVVWFKDPDGNMLSMTEHPA